MRWSAHKLLRSLNGAAVLTGGLMFVNRPGLLINDIIFLTENLKFCHSWSFNSFVNQVDQKHALHCSLMFANFCAIC